MCTEMYPFDQSPTHILASCHNSISDYETIQYFEYLFLQFLENLKSVVNICWDIIFYIITI